MEGKNSGPILEKRDSRISRRLFEELTQQHYHLQKYLIGRLLTIIDGITTDVVQRKAIKDLIEDVVYSSLNRQDGTIRLYSGYLAEALKEECDWLDVPKSGNYNPLTD